MAIKPIEQLKAFFRRGMYPTEQNFADLIDSFVHRGQEAIIRQEPFRVLIKTNPDAFFTAIPAAVPGQAGVMSALDKERVDKIETIEQTAIGAVNNIDTEQVGETLGLHIERGENDYNLPLPLATTSTAGIMSAVDKSSLNTLMEDCVRTLRLETNPSNGVVYLQYSALEGPVAIVLPTVTPDTNGLMSARHYTEFREMTQTLDSLTHRNFERSAQFAFRPGTWVRLAEWMRGSYAVGDFTLRLRHLRFVASIHFTAFCSNVQGGLYPGTRAGNLQFIDRITIATERSTGKTYLYVRLREQLTDPANLPFLELLTQGIGWVGLTPTPITGEVNDTTHAGRTEIVVSSISHTATQQQEGFMSAADKQKLDATAVSLADLFQKVNENRPLIPMDINIVDGVGGKVLELQGNIPEGYTPVVFRKIRRTTKAKDAPYSRPSQWYFYGTANIVEEYGKRFVSFQNPFRERKLVAPFSDHNLPPSPVGAISQAHDFVFIHNVDEHNKAGGQAGYPEKFDLRVSWGRSGRREIFTETQSPPHEVYPATICLELGIGLVKTEIYQATYVSYTRKRRITRGDLASIFVPFKIVTQKPDDWQHTHTYKPKWYFTT